jgi:hypothetical protein
MSSVKRPSSSVDILDRLSHNPTNTRHNINLDESGSKISVNFDDLKIKEIPPLLLYNINERLKQELATKLSPAQVYFSHELFQGPGNAPVVVYYCTKLEHSEKVAKEFLNERILGFDLEWAPYLRSTGSRKENVSLIQLASPSKIALFHIAKHYGDTPEKLLAPTLRKLLESAEIIKTGVNVMGDFKRLKTFLGVNPHAFIELSHIHNLVNNVLTVSGKISKTMISLATLVQQNFGLPLNKDNDVRNSKWHLVTLNRKQTTYAAADAYAGLQLFHALERQRLRMDPIPRQPPFAELAQDITPPPPPSLTEDDDESSWVSENESGGVDSERDDSSQEGSDDERWSQEEQLSQLSSEGSEGSSDGSSTNKLDGRAGDDGGSGVTIGKISAGPSLRLKYRETGERPCHHVG